MIFIFLAFMANFIPFYRILVDLRTHFRINGYHDDSKIQRKLVGSVKKILTR